MASEVRVSEGAVIEFADKGKFHLGVVTGVEEKSGKVRIINASGRDMALPDKQILHNIGMKLSTGSMLLSNIQNELKSLDLRAEDLIAQCDVEGVWQLVVNEYEEISLDDIVTLAIDNPNAVQRLAMIRALRGDKIFFKGLTTETFAPRTEEIVQELQRQRALKAQKDAWRGKFADEAVALLKLDANDRVRAAEEDILPNSEVLDAWRCVENYAIMGIEATDKVEAEALLEVVLKRINRGFAGTANLRARTFLRETGYWTPETNVALLKYEIATQFSEEVEIEAFGVFQKPINSTERVDLTHLNVFSIDDADTLDIDDALSIERLEHGLRLGIHIASPASLIPFDSALEREARHRATSIYLPEQRIPMLPQILSENAISLMQGEKRNAVSFMLTFDDEFNITEQDIVPSIVRSKHRLTYDTAENLLENGDDELADELRLIQEIAEYSAANRRNHGAIDIDLPEYKLEWNAGEAKYELHPIDAGMMSRQLVAECMILANALAAEYCSSHEIPALYRIQPPPNNMPRPETLEAMPNDMIRAFSMRRCMMPAATSMTPDLHAGLGLDKYIQATSPLRRYADLICHYQLEHWFVHQTPRFNADEFNTILSETDLGLSHAKQASHEGYHTATLCYLKQLGNAVLDAMVLQYTTERGDIAQVVLIETQVRANVATKTRLPIGTFCKVRIDNVRPEEDVIQLNYAGLAQ